MAQGPRHLKDSFVSSGVRFVTQILSAAQQAVARTNIGALGNDDDAHFTEAAIDILTAATAAIGPNGTVFSGLYGGTVTLSSGTVTITNANITTSSRILVTRTGGTIAATTVTFLAVPGTGSAVITARAAADTLVNTDASVLSYLIFNA